MKGKIVPFMTVSLKDVSTGEITVLYDIKHTIANLRALVVQDQKVKLSEEKDLSLDNAISGAS